MNSMFLNVSEIFSVIEDMQLKLSEYSESLDTYLEGIVKVDSCWNDINTQSFINIVNEEKELFKEHIEATKKQMNFIVEFCDSLELGLNEMLDENALDKVQYSNMFVNNSLTALDNIKFALEEIYDIHSSIKIPAGCSASYDISSILNNIDSTKATDTKSDIENIINKIKKIISNYQEEANALTIVTVDDKICELNYNSNDN